MATIIEPDSRGARWREAGAACLLRGVAEARGVTARVREALVALEAGLRGVGLRVAMAQN